MPNVFREIRARLDAETVARFYGHEPNRAHFISCPFHRNDQTASLKLYPGEGGWFCFGCNTGGSVLDFVARYFGITVYEAAQKINDDFHLGLDFVGHREPTEAERQEAQRRRELIETQKEYKIWRNKTLDQLALAFRKAHLLNKPPEKMDKSELMAIQWQPAVEYWFDCLLSDDMELQMQVFRDRKDIGKRCMKILDNTRQRSETD